MSNLGNFLTQAAQDMHFTELRQVLVKQISINATARKTVPYPNEGYVPCEPVAVFYTNVMQRDIDVARAIWGSTIDIKWIIYCKATKKLICLMNEKGKVDWQGKVFDLDDILERTILLSKIEP